MHLPPPPPPRELDVAPEAALVAVEEAAEMWGGHFRADSRTAGDLRLPVQAGLRRGLASARVTVAARDDGATVSAHPTAVHYRVHGPAVVVLLFAAAGCGALVLWPFFPSLTALLPVAFLVAVGAWFLVLSRLQNRGLEEFLATVDSLAHEE